MKAKLFISTFLVYFLVSCSPNHSRNTTIIEGQIPAYASKEIQINLKDTIVKTFANKEGSFRLEIFFKNPQYVYIGESDRQLFLLPNDSLFIKKTEDKYIFSGRQSALINNYYTDWETYLYAVTDTSDSKNYYDQTPSDFLQSVNQWIEIWKKPLRELQASHSTLNKDFIALENSRIDYWIYSDLNDYKNSDCEIPDNFYKYLDTVDLNDSELIQLNEYKYFLTSFVLMKSRKAKSIDKIQRTSKMLDIIEKYFINETIKNEISKEIVRIQTSNLSINESLLKRFKTICTDDLYVKEIEDNYQHLKSLTKGKHAPAFEFVGLDGAKTSLSDFKGKYLLIDVWSTTCGPCIREIPFLEKLKQKFKDKNIEIIAVCLSDEIAWRSTLAKHGLKNGQYRVENGWSSDFRNDYLKSSGVPVYILIDPNGLLIDARAQKPSENLEELINSLNI